MSREIKFRVWDTQSKVFTCGYKNHNDFEEIYADPPGLLFGALNYLQKYNYRYTIQQFTGLKDQKGTDIFEGDIIKYGFPIGRTGMMKEFVEEVVWENHGWVLLGRAEEGTYANPLFFIPKMVVIGNIHEHPELLKITK